MDHRCTRRTEPTSKSSGRRTRCPHEHRGHDRHSGSFRWRSFRDKFWLKPRPSRSPASDLGPPEVPTLAGVYRRLSSPGSRLIPANPRNHRLCLRRALVFLFPSSVGQRLSLPPAGPAMMTLISLAIIVAFATWEIPCKTTQPTLPQAL